MVGTISPLHFPYRILLITTYCSTTNGSNIISTKYFASFSIAFDGKKSLSAAGRNRKEKIDHYTVVSRGNFLDLFVPKDGTGAQIAYQLHELLKNYLAKNSLIYIGSDSTGSNTGWYAL